MTIKMQEHGFKHTHSEGKTQEDLSSEELQYNSTLRMVALLKLPINPIYTSWVRDDFNYPSENQDIEQPKEYYSRNALLEDGNTMARMQVSDEDITMEFMQQQSSIGFEIPRWDPKRKASGLSQDRQK
ncbi:MAG: hypothetical protein JOS17DRAFT_781665 [Linnemannia elongata]|nr:MAG: hypothetical protein JOS17DRAFT_781665 [Linnemannia elongata]